MQYHFVVYYDTDTNCFHMDYETLSVMFPNGTVFDTVSNEWRLLETDERDDDDSGYSQISDHLAIILEAY